MKASIKSTVYYAFTILLLGLNFVLAGNYLFGIGGWNSMIRLFGLVQLALAFVAAIVLAVGCMCEGGKEKTRNANLTLIPLVLLAIMQFVPASFYSGRMNMPELRNDPFMWLQFTSVILGLLVLLLHLLAMPWKRDSVD